MKDPFENYYSWYPEFNKFSNPIPRPQPIDAVIAYFNGKENGYFVDVGAYDGVTWSNSLALEKNHNWKGICIEPNETAFETLQKERSAKAYKVAATDFDGTVDFVKVLGWAEVLSGISTSMPPDHLQRIEEEIRVNGGQKIITEVPAMKIQTILEAEGVREIDYLSLDVECGEVNALKGIDLRAFNVKLISCESNAYDAENRDQLFYYLSSNGYRHLGRVCGDEFFEKVS